jgi:hypothetical protein
MSDTPVDDQEVKTAVSNQNSLLQATADLFAGMEGDTAVLSDKREVNIRTAKVKQLRDITAFIQGFLGRLEGSQVVDLIDKLSIYQQKKIAEGVSPYQMGTKEMILEIIGSANVLSVVLDAAVTELPKLLPIFSSLSAEEVDELELDDATVVAFHIFGKNYHFFSRQVLPLIRGCIESLRQKQKHANK